MMPMAVVPVRAIAAMMEAVVSITVMMIPVMTVVVGHEVQRGAAFPALHGRCRER